VSMRKGGFVTVSSSEFDSAGVLIETASSRTALAFGNVLPAVVSSWRHAAAEVSR
jgi:hypothetical protein